MHLWRVLYRPFHSWELCRCTIYTTVILPYLTQSFCPSGLQSNLTAELFGQHIIVNELASVLQAHYSDNMAKKPLVLSFQGPSGTGKTFVTDLIADYMYKAGTSSRFLHRFTGRLDFPLDSKVEEYKGLYQYFFLF